jgi:cytochrome c-type biogenesis protein CcmH/NrfG
MGARDILPGLQFAGEEEMRLLKRKLVSAAVGLCLFEPIVLAQSPVAAVSQAERDMRAGQYPRAEAELLNALKRDPQDGSLWFLLGVTRAQLKKTDPAIEAFEKALRLAPDKAPVYFDLGLLYMEKNDVSNAEEAYGRGLTLDPSNVPANQNYALLLMQRGEYREASIPLERLKKITPNDVSVRATLIEAYLKSGLKDKGENEIDELLSAHVVILPQGLALAKLLHDNQETDAAQRVLESLKSSWPNSAEAHGELGLILTEKEKFRDAAMELWRAVQLDPDSEKYSLGYGEALMSSEQYPVALPFLLGAQKRFVNQPNFPYQLAITDICLQRFSDAISVLDSLARERPDSGKVQFLLGGAYELSGELQTAEDHYRSAIRLVPQEPKYYRVLASLLQKQGPEELAESIQLLRKALALDPTDAESKIVLARCLEKQGELDEAASLLEQAVVNEPASRRAHSALAEVYRRQQKLAQAEQQQSIAAKLEEEKITKEWDIWGPKSAGGP